MISLTLDHSQTLLNAGFAKGSSDLHCYDCRAWCGRCSKFKARRVANDKACGEIEEYPPNRFARREA